VVAAYKSAKANNGNIKPLVHTTPIDLLESIIALDDELDLATFHVVDSLVQSSGGTALDCRSNWPPPSITSGDTLSFSGFPEILKTAAGPDNIPFHAFVGMLHATSVTDKDIKAVWDPTTDLRPISNPAVPKVGPNISGCSGGPVLLHRDINGMHRWFPVGVIIEGPRGGDMPVDTFIARRLDFVQTDGTISRPYTGGWLPG
jgi:hypothetical protein